MFLSSHTLANDLSRMPLKQLKATCQQSYLQGCYQEIYTKEIAERRKIIEFLGKLCYLGEKKSCKERRKLKKQIHELNLPLKQAKKGNVAAQYDLGIYYLNQTKPNYSEGLKWLNKAIEANYPLAQYELAYLHQLG